LIKVFCGDYWLSLVDFKPVVTPTRRHWDCTLPFGVCDMVVEANARAVISDHR